MNPINKDLSEKLRKTTTVTVPSGVVRTRDEAELASVVGGMRSTRAGL